MASVTVLTLSFSRSRKYVLGEVYSIICVFYFLSQENASRQVVKLLTTECTYLISQFKIEHQSKR